jgi:hypothetical protein
MPPGIQVEWALQAPFLAECSGYLPSMVSKQGEMAASTPGTR